MALNIVPPPLSGDPDAIGRFARSYGQTAEALREATSELRKLANENVTISKAVDEVRGHAQDAYGQVEKVATRYEGASSAYYAYRDSLRAAQDRANAARARISATNSSVSQYWVRRQGELKAQAMFGAGGGIDGEQLLQDLEEANRRVKSVLAEYADALREYNAAADDKRDAVTRAMAALDDAAEAAGLNDSFWEGLVGAAQQLYELAQRYLAPVIEQLREVLELIKSIVDLLSLIFTVLAIFIPALAPIALALQIASIALSAMILLCSLTLYVLGKESLGRVLGDTIGLVASIVTSKIGGGGAHAAASSAAAPTFAQVAAANGGVIRTVFAAAQEVTIRTSTEVLTDLAVDTASHLAETGLDIRVDQFPNEHAVGRDGVLSAHGNAITWDFNSFTDPGAHAEFVIDQSIGILDDYVPGLGEVLNVVDQAGDVFGNDDLNIPALLVKAGS